MANDNTNLADDPSGVNWDKVVSDGEAAQAPPVQAPPVTEDDPTGVDWNKVVSNGSDPEQNLRTSMYNGMQYQPDRMAKAVPMAAAQGISPDMAYRQMDDKDWTQGAMFDENNYQQLIKDYPKLSNFLSDQNNAAISHDDIGPLQKLEDWGNQWAADNKGKSAYEMMENDPLNPLSRLQALASATGGGFGLVARGLGQALLNTSSLGNLPGASPVDKFLMQGTGLAGKGLLGFANFMEGQAKEFAPQNQDLLNKALGLGGSLVPLAAGGPLAMGSQMMGQTYEHADQMKLPLNSPRVNGAALLSGIIGTFGGMMVGKAAGAVIPEAAGVYAGNMADKARQLVNATPGSAREAMVNRTMDYATSLIHAVAGFAGYTLAQNSVFRGVLQDQSTQYSTGVAEAAKEGGAFGLITAMLGHGAALINNYHDTVSQPEMTKESLRQAGELVQESKLQGRSPQKMNDYLNQQLGDNSLYVRPANFQTFFSKLPPETQGEITKNMPEIPDQLSNALKTGEDMEINQADYHTYIQPHGPALDDWMRLAPEHFSVGDQAEYQKHMDEVQAVQEEETPSGRGSGQVYDRMYDQLQQPVGERIAPTGMPHIADTYATAIQNSYDALVENYGHILGAKDFIDSFLGNAKILREYPHMMASRIKSTDDDLWLDQMRNLAKKSGNTSKAPTPLIDFLKKKGIQEGSNAAQTLESLGITKQTHRTLFRKAPEEAGNDMFPGTKTKSDKHGITDFSDIDVNDLNNELGDHGYQFREGEQHGADPDAVADALRRESFGEGQKRDDIEARDQALEELSNALDQEGIDLTTATNDQIRAALDRLSSAYSKQNGQEFFQHGESLEDFKKRVIGKYDAPKSRLGSSGVVFDPAERGNIITLQSIRVPGSMRDKGIGTEIMKALVDHADANGKIIALSPTSDFGGNLGRLKKFYKGFGFVENKGRNKDFSTKETMIREPKGKSILYQGDGDGARGSVSFGPNQETVIRLFSRERLDTLLHEMGHVYFTALRHIAELPGAEGAAEDVKALKDWAKQDTDYIHRYVTKFSPYEVREMPNGSYKVFANGQEPDEEQVADDTKTGAERFAAAQNERIQKQYQDLGGEEFLKNIAYGSYTEGDLERHIQTGYEEKMADALLSYVRDGEAPSAEIKPAFDKFKAWVTRLYAGERDTLPKINPEVKQVFDRMFATESQIQKMKAQPEFNIDPAISSFLNKVDQTRYQRSWSRMVSEAQDRLFRQAMKQSEVAGGKEYKEARASFKEEAQAQADSEQRFKAADQIRSAGGLSRDGLTKLFGKEVLKKEYLGVHGLLAKRGEKGIDPQMMATITGYRSAKEMVDTFMNMPKKADYVNQLTDNLMVERKGDMLKDGTIEREAVEAYHNNMRAEVLGFEMKKLAALAKIDAPSPEMMKVRATTMLGDRVLKDVRPYSFYRAEVNAARDVGKNLAKKNFEAAAVAKAKQLLNHHLYKMSTDAKASMNRTLEKWGDVLRRSDDKLAKKYDIDYIYAARKIASDHGFPVKSNFFDFATWQKNLEANDPETAKILNDTLSVAQMGDKTPFNAMTWNDFQTLRDDIGCLIEQANGQRTITLEGEKFERTLVKQKIADGLANFDPVMSFEDLRFKSQSTGDAVKKKMLGATMHFTRMESWVNRMDGGKFDGPMRTYLYKPVRKAVDNYLAATRDATNQAKEVLGHIDLLGDQITANELKTYDKTGEPINNGQGYTFANKGELIGMLVHTGNGYEPGSNGYKLLRGNAWHLDDLQAFMDRAMSDGTITKQDMDTVQGMWKMMDSMRPDIWRAHKQMYGFYPKEVTAVPIKTPHGDYDGGYWPVKYDPVKDDHIAAQYEKNSLTSNATHAWPTTGKASTMSRDTTFARPIQMKLEFLPAHIDWAMRFAHVEPAVREAAKIMFDPEIRAALDRINPAVRSSVILPWLQRTARQDFDLSSGGTIKEFGGVANFVKDAFYMKTLGLNLKYPLQRLGEIAPIIHDTDYASFQSAFSDLVRDNATTRQGMNSDSEFMNQRGLMFDENAAKQLRNLITDRNPYEKISDFSREHAYYTVRETHKWLDDLQWLSAKNFALNGKAKGVDPDNYQQVIDYADSRVRTTQATFGPSDVSNIEGGSQSTKALWTVFYSVMNTKFNAAYTEFKLIKDTSAPVQARGIAMASMFINRLMLPMFISDQILHYINQGGPTDQHHEHSVKAWAEALAFDGIKSLTSLVPVVGEGADTLLAPLFKDMGEKPYNDTLQVSPGITSIADDIFRVMPHDLYNAMFKHGSKAKALTSVLTALGDVAKVPVTQVEKTLGYLAAVHSGKQQPHGAMDVARGLIGGPNIKN